MILSNKHITKALIGLHGCTGWSAPLLFVNPKDRFSRVEALLALCCLIHTCDSSFPALFCQSICILNNTIINSKIFWLGMRYLQKFIININPKFSGTLTTYHISFIIICIPDYRAQWLSGRVLESRLKSRRFKPHWRHCVMVLEQNTFILA